MAQCKPKVFKDGQYSDPVYKKLAAINGEINKMTKDEIKGKLAELKLDTRGVKDVLKKRLKNYYKRRKLMKARIRPTGNIHYDYFAVIDFEATCEENNINFRHEIIEFPIVLIDVKEMKIVDKFHEYCRPVINPNLTPFCSQLTGITQEMVDRADQFPAVLNRVTDWMKSHKLGEGASFAPLTDGPWDMYRFMFNQCEHSNITLPKWSKRWVNIRKAYSNFYQCKRGGIETMLTNLGMEFEGKPHCGMDDATNIARIAIHMLEDGCKLKINEFLHVKHYGPHGRPEVRYEAIAETCSSAEEDENEQKEGSSDHFSRGDYCSAANEEQKAEERCSRVESGQQLETLGDAMKSLSLSPKNTSSLQVEEEGVDDLLHYYNLQSS